ncbi:unnamed protein product [Lupinus luteus]|uniref:Uncharacterized protein n=1 Tax=Lupinus luteus TaxID=3873 RepID=A0AAV1XF82_LUPLU
MELSSLATITSKSQTICRKSHKTFIIREKKRTCRVGGDEICNMKGLKNGEKDEELYLFKELRKRQNERVSTLMQYASEDFEYDSNGCGE